MAVVAAETGIPIADLLDAPMEVFGAITKYLHQKYAGQR